jgi:hypothetical protein
VEQDCNNRENLQRQEDIYDIQSSADLKEEIMEDCKKNPELHDIYK